MSWDSLVSSCKTVEGYVKILKFLEQDNIFNNGRKLILIEYTKSVCLANPDIAPEIVFHLSEFLEKHYTSEFLCFIL